MNADNNDTHEPTPDFRAALRRDMLDTFRRERQFASDTTPSRARRVGTIVGLAAGAVFMLSLGLVLGTNTGLAWAEASDGPTAGHAPAKRIPMRNALAITCAAMALAPALAPASATTPAPTPVTVPPVAPEQQGIPTIDLPVVSATTTQPLGFLYGVREVAGGKLIVNDGGNRQVRLFDASLASSIVTLDSAGGGEIYPLRRPRQIPLSPYRGDSSILPDPRSRTIRVLDGNGQVARTVALPVAPVDLSSPSYTDDKGRLLYSGLRNMWGAGPASTSIVRIDLASGRVDTVVQMKHRGAVAFTGSADTTWYARGELFGEALVSGYDAWALMSNGTVGLVRGSDYHIDWIRADGTISSTAKLPFDWNAWSNHLKKAADSARVLDSLLPSFRQAVVAGRGGSGRGVNAGDSTKTVALRAKLSYTMVQAYTARILGAGTTDVIPDLDGNLWILPTGSTVLPATSLVYDVVNGKGELFQRVRAPAGRSIVGFGKGGAVYLASGDRTNGYRIERTILVKR